MELSPNECNIYSFHSVGPDVSMEVDIEAMYDSFENIWHQRSNWRSPSETRLGKLHKHP